MTQQFENEWIIVKRQKRRYNTQKILGTKKILPKGMEQPYEETEQGIQQFQLSDCCIKNKKIVWQHLQPLGERYQVICLGLGNFGTYLKPRLQFYFLKYCLLSELQANNLQHTLTVYDPVFTACEKGQINKIGGKVDATISLSTTAVNVLFMPHCQRFLYEQIYKLKQNQSECRVIVIGNSINDYVERCQLIKQPIPSCFPTDKLLQKKLIDLREAFNDTYVYNI